MVQSNFLGNENFSNIICTLHNRRSFENNSKKNLQYQQHFNVLIIQSTSHPTGIYYLWNFFL